MPAAKSYLSTEHQSVMHDIRKIKVTRFDTIVTVHFYISLNGPRHSLWPPVFAEFN